MQTPASRLAEAHVRLESWLAATPPDGLLPLSDRLLVRTLAPRRSAAGTELRDLHRRASLVGMALQQLLREGRSEAVTAALVILWCLADRAVPRARLEATLRSAVGAIRPIATTWPEPHRSTFLYWLERTGLGAREPAGPPPEDPLLRLYHDLHLGMFASRYGRRRVDRDEARDAHAAVRRVLASPACLTNADLVAEALLVELALDPADPAAREALVAALLDLQREDGSLTMPEGATPANRHHAACVATLVLARLLRDDAGWC